MLMKCPVLSLAPVQGMETCLHGKTRALFSVEALDAHPEGRSVGDPSSGPSSLISDLRKVVSESLSGGLPCEAAPPWVSLALCFSMPLLGARETACPEPGRAVSSWNIPSLLAAISFFKNCLAFILHLSWTVWQEGKIPNLTCVVFFSSPSALLRYN